jgi:hypothetical protein
MELVSWSCPLIVDSLNRGTRWAVLQKGVQLTQRLTRSLGNHFDRAIMSICYPASQTELPGGAQRIVAETDTLNAAANHCVEARRILILLSIPF